MDEILWSEDSNLTLSLCCKEVVLYLRFSLFLVVIDDLLRKVNIKKAATKEAIVIMRGSILNIMKFLKSFLLFINCFFIFFVFPYLYFKRKNILFQVTFTK